jgi:GntR family transcriptional regulator
VIVMGSAGQTGSTIVAEPYFRQIMADIRARIASGEWPPGTRLPSTKELTQFYRGHLGSETLAQSTVRQAVTLLIETGDLVGQQGLGVFVTDRPS